MPPKETADHPGTEQGGNDGHEGDRHGHIARIGRGDTENHLHLRPAGTQQGIRQPQADKNQIDDRKQQGTHGSFLPGFSQRIIYILMFKSAVIESQHHFRSAAASAGNKTVAFGKQL